MSKFTVVLDYIIGFVVLYLAGAFISLEQNPLLWEPAGRLLLVLAASLGIVFGGIARLK